VNDTRGVVVLIDVSGFKTRMEERVYYLIIALLQNLLPVFENFSLEVRVCSLRKPGSIPIRGSA
jgi:hypothetical protein